jgi:hypothetical protein
MPEVRGQDRQEAFGVFPRAVPSQQRRHGEAMSQIVQPRPMTLGGTAQTDLPG